MKKVIRLTERDLTRIVRRVINEQSPNEGPTLEYFKKNPKGTITSRYVFVTSVNNNFQQLRLHPDFFSELRVDDQKGYNNIPQTNIEWDYVLENPIVPDNEKLLVTPRNLKVTNKYWFFIKK